MDNNIYSKLTESAKKALDETKNEVLDMIVEKAYSNANLKNTADEEISLSDVIEAKEEILYRKNVNGRQESKKKRLVLMLSMSGAVYSIFGILFYLFQNKNFDTAKDSGLIIAALGILISIVTFYYSQLLTKRKVELIKNNVVIERDNSEFEIVRRWQIIEKLGSDLMLKEGVSDSKRRSFNFILSYLSKKLENNVKIEELKKLLTVRNKIVHGGISLTNFEKEEMIKSADSIIDELEQFAK